VVLLYLQVVHQLVIALAVNQSVKNPLSAQNVKALVSVRNNILTLQAKKVPAQKAGIFYIKSLFTK
jgi:hypothetical protein